MKILVSVAGFPYAKKTFEFGVVIARLYGASVTLLTVVANKSEKQGAKQALKQLVVGYEDLVETVLVKKGTAVSKIIRECEDGEYDMLVLGTRTVHGISLVQSSRIARRVSKGVSIPLFVVKQETDVLHKILVCTAGTEKSGATIEAGIHLAQLAQAEMHILYVADPMPQRYVGLERMEETVQEVIESGTPIAQHLHWVNGIMQKMKIPGKIKVRHGLVIDEILHETEETHYDLILVSAPHHHNIWQVLALGNISPRLIENAPCSVMVVRT